jgi:hypothetical protein
MVLLRRPRYRNRICRLTQLDIINLHTRLPQVIPLQQLLIARTLMRRIEIRLWNIFILDPAKRHQACVGSAHQSLSNNVNAVLVMSFVEPGAVGFDGLVGREVVEMVVAPDGVEAVQVVHAFGLGEVAL